MQKFVTINQEEWESLFGLSLRARCLYLYLRWKMNKETGIVGAKFRISYQSCWEHLSHEQDKCSTKTKQNVNSYQIKSRIRASISELIRHSLVNKVSNSWLILELPKSHRKGALKTRATHERPSSRPDEQPNTNLENSNDNSGLQKKTDDERPYERHPKTAKNDTPHRQSLLTKVNKNISIQKSQNLNNTAIARELFECWKKEHNYPRSKLSPSRIAKIKRMLSLGYTQKDLTEAIYGCLNSDWHMGRDKNTGGKKYNSFELIFRSAEKIDQFISYNKLPKGGQRNGQHKNKTKRQLYLEELEREIVERGYDIFGDPIDQNGEVVEGKCT